MALIVVNPRSDNDFDYNAPDSLNNTLRWYHDSPQFSVDIQIGTYTDSTTYKTMLKMKATMNWIKKGDTGDTTGKGINVPVGYGSKPSRYGFDFRVVAPYDANDLSESYVCGNGGSRYKSLADNSANTRMLHHTWRENTAKNFTTWGGWWVTTKISVADLLANAGSSDIITVPVYAACGSINRYRQADCNNSEFKYSLDVPSSEYGVSHIKAGYIFRIRFKRTAFYNPPTNFTMSNCNFTTGETVSFNANWEPGSKETDEKIYGRLTTLDGQRIYSPYIDLGKKSTSGIYTFTNTAFAQMTSADKFRINRGMKYKIDAFVTDKSETGLTIKDTGYNDTDNTTYSYYVGTDVNAAAGGALSNPYNETQFINSITQIFNDYKTRLQNTKITGTNYTLFNYPYTRTLDFNGSELTPGVQETLGTTIFNEPASSISGFKCVKDRIIELCRTSTAQNITNTDLTTTVNNIISVAKSAIETTQNMQLSATHDQFIPKISDYLENEVYKRLEDAIATHEFETPPATVETDFKALAENIYDIINVYINAFTEINTASQEEQEHKISGLDYLFAFDGDCAAEMGDNGEYIYADDVARELVESDKIDADAPGYKSTLDSFIDNLKGLCLDQTDEYLTKLAALVFAIGKYRTHEVLVSTIYDVFNTGLEFVHIESPEETPMMDMMYSTLISALNEIALPIDVTDQEYVYHLIYTINNSAYEYKSFVDQLNEIYNGTESTTGLAGDLQSISMEVLNENALRLNLSDLKNQDPIAAIEDTTYSVNLTYGGFTTKIIRFGANIASGSNMAKNLCYSLVRCDRTASGQGDRFDNARQLQWYTLRGYEAPANSFYTIIPPIGTAATAPTTVPDRGPNDNMDGDESLPDVLCNEYDNLLQASLYEIHTWIQYPNRDTSDTTLYGDRAGKDMVNENGIRDTEEVIYIRTTALSDISAGSTAKLHQHYIVTSWNANAVVIDDGRMIRANANDGTFLIKNFAKSDPTSYRETDARYTLWNSNHLRTVLNHGKGQDIPSTLNFFFVGQDLGVKPPMVPEGGVVVGCSYEHIPTPNSPAELNMINDPAPKDGEHCNLINDGLIYKYQTMSNTKTGGTGYSGDCYGDYNQTYPLTIMFAKNPTLNKFHDKVYLPESISSKKLISYWLGYWAWYRITCAITDGHNISHTSVILRTTYPYTRILDPESGKTYKTMPLVYTKNGKFEQAVNFILKNTKDGDAILDDNCDYFKEAYGEDMEPPKG